jgi:hypothetical protein
MNQRLVIFLAAAYVVVVVVGSWMILSVDGRVMQGPWQPTTAGLYVAESDEDGFSLSARSTYCLQPLHEMPITRIRLLKQHSNDVLWQAAALPSAMTFGIDPPDVLSGPHVFLQGIEPGIRLRLEIEVDNQIVEASALPTISLLRRGKQRLPWMSWNGREPVASSTDHLEAPPTVR